VLGLGFRVLGIPGVRGESSSNTLARLPRRAARCNGGLCRTSRYGI